MAMASAQPLPGALYLGTAVSTALLAGGVWLWQQQVIIAGLTGCLICVVVFRMFRSYALAATGRRTQPRRASSSRQPRRWWPRWLKHRKRFRLLFWRVNTSQGRYTSTTTKVGPYSSNSRTGRRHLDLPWGFSADLGRGRSRRIGRRRK